MPLHKDITIFATLSSKINPFDQTLQKLMCNISLYDQIYYFKIRIWGKD